MARSKIGSISVEVEARLAKFESDIGRAARILEREMSRSAARTEQSISSMRKQIEKEMGAVKNAALQTRNAFLALIGIDKGLEFVKVLARMNDGYINIQAQLMQTTRTQQQLTRATRETFEISQRTYASFESTALLVGRTARALRSAGVDQEQAMMQAQRFSESINNAFLLSGAKAIEAKNAILQLSQGLASGTLRGDEYRSVAEQGSKVTEILAKNLTEVDGKLQLANGSLGVTTGRLRELAYEGKLTTDLVVGAMSAGFDELASGVDKIPLTIERAFTRLTNAAENYVGTSQELRSISAELASFVNMLAVNFDDLADAVVTVAAAFGTIASARAISSLVAFIDKLDAQRLARVAEADATLAAARAEQAAAVATVEAASAEVALQDTRVRATAAIVAQTSAEYRLTAAKVGSTLADIERLKLHATLSANLALLRTLQEQYTTALARQAAANEALLQQEALLIRESQLLTAATIELAAAKDALAVADGRLAVAQTGAAASALTLGGVLSKVGSGALALLGGWLGAAIVAVAGLGYGLSELRDAFQDGNDAIIEYNSILRKSTDSSAEAAAARAQELENLMGNIRAQREAIIVSKAELEQTSALNMFLKANAVGYYTATKLSGSYSEQIAELSHQLSEANEQLKQFKDTQKQREADDKAKKSIEDFIEGLQKQNDKLREQTVELQSGARALLLYQAVKAGVFNDKAAVAVLERELRTFEELTAGVNRLKAAEKERKDAQKTADKERRSAELAERRAARDFERQFRNQEKAAKDLAKAYADVDKLLLEVSDQYSGPMRAALQSNRDDLNTLIDAESELMLRYGDNKDAMELLAQMYDLVNAKAQKRIDIANEEEDVFGKVLRGLDEEISILRIAAPLREEEVLVRQAVQEAKEKDVKLSPAYIESMRAEIRERLATRDALESQAAALEDMQGIFEGFAESSADALSKLFVEGVKGMDDFMDSMLDLVKKGVADMLAEFFKLDIINPLLNNLLGGSRPTGFFNTLGGGGAFAEYAGAGLMGAGTGAFIGSNIFGGSRQNTLGGSLGGMAGGIFASTTFGATMIGSGLSAMGVGASLGSIVPVVGTIIGAVIGSALGQFFEQDPRLRVGGGSVVQGRSTRRTFDTALGTVGFFDTEEQSNKFLDSLMQAVTDFDAAIASFLNPDQIAAATQALATTNFRYDNGKITPEQILGDRFDVILGTFEGYIQDFVGTTGDLEDRVQRLADALTIDQIAQSGSLLSDFGDLAALLEDLQGSNETLVDTANRLVASTMVVEQAFSMAGTSIDWTREQLIRFSADAAEAAGGVETLAARFQEYFNQFYDDNERSAYQLSSLTSVASTQFQDIGLDITQFQGREGMAQFRALFESQMGSLSGEALAQWLEAANALSALVNLQEEMNAANEDAVEPLEISLDALRSYAEAVRNINDQIAQLEMSDFQYSLREIAENLNQNIDNLNSLARAAGLSAAREQDLARAHQLAAMQAARAAAQLEQQARRLVSDLGLDALSGVEAEIARLEAQAQDSASVVRDFGDAVSDVTDSIRDNINLLLGDLSPLKDREKLRIAMEAQRNGIVGPEDVLRIAQRLFASGEDYNQIFRQVMAVGDRRQQGSGRSPGSTSTTTTTISPELQQLYAERDALIQQQRQAERFGQANELAQMIADLAGFRGQTFEEVAASLGIQDLNTLVEDLNLGSLDDLFSLLSAMQAESYTIEDIASTVTAGDQLIVDTLYTLLSTSDIGGEVAVPTVPVEADEVVVGGENGTSLKSSMERQEQLNLAVLDALMEIAKNTGASSAALDRLASVSQEQAELKLMTTNRNSRTK